MASLGAGCALGRAHPLGSQETTQCPPTSHMDIDMVPAFTKHQSEPQTCTLGPACTAGAAAQSPSTSSDFSAASSCITLHLDLSRSPSPDSSLASAALGAGRPSEQCLLTSHRGVPTSNTSSTSNLPCSTELWRRTQSFIAVLTTSPVVASAVASVQVHGHPTVGEALATSPVSDLKWTISGMLAYFLESGVSAATEEILIAILWIMESWSDAHRSSATTVLGDYLRHLAAFDAHRARTMSANWRESFCAMRADVVEAQAEILNGLIWDVSMKDETILFSQQLLFEGGARSLVQGEKIASDSNWQNPAFIYTKQVLLTCQRVIDQAARIAYSAARKRAQEAAAAASLSISSRAKRAATPIFAATQTMGASMCPPEAKRFRRTVMERITPAPA